MHTGPGLEAGWLGNDEAAVGGAGDEELARGRPDVHL